MYTAEISRRNPSCLLLLIDQSASMADPLGTTPDSSGQPEGAITYRTKAQEAANATNRLLQNLVLKCARSNGVRDLFSAGALGYGQQVGPALGGALAGRDLVPISEIANAPARLDERSRKVSDGAGGFIEQTVMFPIWLNAVANDGTPMCRAFRRADTILRRWLSMHPDCFPPTVINITGGQSTDGDPTAAAQALRYLTSSDGNVLLFNLLVSSASRTPSQFPHSEAGLPDSYARMLYRMSSLLPDYMLDIARHDGFPGVEAGARGFVFNADIVSVIRFLDIGTRSSNLR